MRFDLSVVAPCFNEEANLPTLVARLLRSVEHSDICMQIVLVDDGSTDTTWNVIQTLEQQYAPLVKGVRHEVNKGIPDGWRSGVAQADGAYVCFIDADLQNPPEEVAKLYRRLLESTCDVAQGTRSSIGRLKDSRLTFSRGLNFLLNFAFGMRAQDNKSGFLLGPKAVMQDVVTVRRDYRHFQTFIGVSAHAKGYSTLEVETLFESRHAGTSFLASKATRVMGECLRDFVPALREFRFGRRDRRGLEVAPSVIPVQQTRHPYSGWRRVLFELYFATMPLHKWQIRRRARRLYLDLKTTERMAKPELQALQLEKLKRLVQHAYVHVPYYRQAMFDAGVAPGDITSLEDISRLPLLGKQDVRDNLYFDLFSDDHDKNHMMKISTSGSTGEPFVVYADRHQLEMRFATTLRALEWTGWRFGDRQARLWHQTIGMSRSQVIRERIDSWFMRRLFIPAYELRADNLERFVDRIRRHNPVLVDGYAESLNFLAAYVKQGGSAGFSPLAMMSSAQVLPENVLKVIEGGFCTRVYDKYGSREFSGIAYSCEASRDHHVMDESYVVELLVDGRPARSGEIGEVVVTDLNNFSFPLIRFRIGDLATAVYQESCACGRNHSKIGRIEGRTQAIVHCGNGAWLPGTFFAHYFKEYDYLIRFFQIMQERPNEFELLLVKGDQFTDAGLDALVSGLREFVGTEEQTYVRVRFVESIPMVRTGKRSPVVSSVALDFQDVSRKSEDQHE
jgi:phenylacetate-CoA ligase